MEKNAALNESLDSPDVMVSKWTLPSLTFKYLRADMEQTCVSPSSCVCSDRRFSVRLEQSWQRLHSVGGPWSAGAEIKAEEGGDV